MTKINRDTILSALTPEKVRAYLESTPRKTFARAEYGECVIARYLEDTLDQGDYRVGYRNTEFFSKGFYTRVRVPNPNWVEDYIHAIDRGISRNLRIKKATALKHLEEVTK